MNWLKRLFCRHNTVHVTRRHVDTVTNKQARKVLYVDKYKVWNFVQCHDCGKFFNTEQRDVIQEQEDLWKHLKH